MPLPARAPWLAPVLAAAAGLQAVEAPPPYDVTRDKVLYVVPYAHLDTQWRWTYITTIDQFIRNTIDENLARFRTFPDNVFTFTGSIRYEMMREYYPEGYAQVKELIRAGRWKVGGSSVDENDGNVPSPESVMRQILYGNRYFRREFGRESIDYMLPDCFGFQAHLPSVFAHCGLRGFSTQKLVWGLPFKLPFTVGVWEGIDGKGVITGFYGTDYTGKVEERLDRSEEFARRIDVVGKASGYYVDYRYFGVGDRGGAPREDDIRRALASRGNPDSRFTVVLAGSDQMVRDLPRDAEEKLPRYKGDLLLREHSCGSISSQAYMKRWNRKNEQLADAAERAAVIADWLGAQPYPGERLEAAWYRVLGSQMHDILPGTSLPRAYELSWNDEVVALNLFAGVLEHAASGVVKAMDTAVDGVPLVVYNPLATAREDVVEAALEFPEAAPAGVAVSDAVGRPVPAQVLERSGRTARIAVLAAVKPVSWSVFAVRAGPALASPALQVSQQGLENAHYRVRLDANGDVASIIDKRNGGREMLASPHQLQYQYHKPRDYPAWNMDWSDQQKPPVGVVGGPAEVRVVEEGPVRVALEVRRQGRDSLFVQRIRLAAGEAGARVEFATTIDWQGRECALKAAFPFTVANPEATYNLGLGCIQRPTNHKDMYEVPHREWMDLTASDNSYGVSLLEDCKFGSDKPDDRTLRLTLLYTPGVRGGFHDQYSQDWGRHDMTYAVYGHPGDWRNGTERQARAVNQPLVAFQPARHGGVLGRELSFVSVSSPQVDLRTLKGAEDGGRMVVRLQELLGRPAPGVTVAFAAPVAEAWEVDGQERRIGPATVTGGALTTDLGAFSPRSFAVKLASAAHPVAALASLPVALAYDDDVVSNDGLRTDGRMDAEGRSYPGEQFPARLDWHGISFTLGPVLDGAKNALACHGQRLTLPAGDYDRVAFLAAASERVSAEFAVGPTREVLAIPAWTGFIGQFDNRQWNRAFGDIDYTCNGKVTGFIPGFIHREPVAWFAHHRHGPAGNEAYRFCYLFARELPLAGGERILVLPDDPRIRLFALSLVRSGDAGTRPAQPLYDDFSARGPLPLRAGDSGQELVQGLRAVGMEAIDRKASFAELSMGAPSASDYADQAAGNGVEVRLFDGGGRFRPHAQAGAANGLLPRLNDGKAAQNGDDTRRCSWYDNEGRFGMDLKKPLRIARVNTFSWHKSDRAPQRFTLWASNAETMPDPLFAVGKGSLWTLLGKVDTSTLGEGGCHGSSVMAKDGGALGPFRWLLWIAEEQGEGTFFTELDVHEAK